MPFKSEKQRKFLWAKRPDIAKRWAEEYGSHPVGRSEEFHHGRGKKNKRGSEN